MVIAVILAEGIWGFIVAVTNNLVLPLLARIMGGDAQSPLYLGKGDFNVPGAVYLGSGALLCGDRRRDSEFLGATKAQADVAASR